MPRQGLGQCSPLQTWVQQVGLWQAGTGQPLLSATGNATFLPGAPHLWPRAGRYRLALQDAHHTGAGDKGGASEDRDLPASPGPSCPAGSPCLPGLLAHQLSHSPAITSLSSRLSQDLSPDPTEWLWFSRIPKGAGAGRALQMAQPITNPAQSSTRCLHPRGPGSWWMEDTEAPGTSPGTQELPIPICSPRLAPVGRVEGASWEGTAVLGG